MQQRLLFLTLAILSLIRGHTVAFVSLYYVMCDVMELVTITDEETTLALYGFR
jgi:cytochrome c oxidase assembly protein Cox11